MPSEISARFASGRGKRSSRAGLVGSVPENYTDVLDEVAALVDPLLAP